MGNRRWQQWAWVGALVVGLGAAVPSLAAQRVSEADRAPALGTVPRTLKVSAPRPLATLPGVARPSMAVDVTIESPRAGDTIAFTVFEPSNLADGQRYPLVLHGHGFGSSRLKADSGSGPSSQVPGDLEGAAGVQDLLANGYGVISIDQRGHGDSAGAVRVMDPDFEGQNLIAVVDWAEANLPWLMYRAGPDGRNNLVLGAMGGSYGGMYQLLLTHIDPKQRLDAIVPEIAPHHLPFSLAPTNTPKTLWLSALFGIGTAAGRNTGSTFDPYIIQELPQALLNTKFSQGLLDLASYHSTSYWCGNRRVATNGGPGTRPQYLPNRKVKINALVVQGMRDTLFNFNDGFNNYQCLAARGGDVRMMTTQTGHNVIPVVPDAGAFTDQNPQDITKAQCGRVATQVARRAFFDEHLKGVAGAANDIPKDVCVSLTADDAVLVPKARITGGRTSFAIPATSVVAGVPAVPVVVPLGDAAGADGLVLAGIPRLTLKVASALPALPLLPRPEALFYVGVGVMRSNGNVVLADNQITPLRGLGLHQVDLIGVGERLATGERLALLFYGAHEQFASNAVPGGSPLRANVAPLTVQGSVAMPIQPASLPAP